MELWQAIAIAEGMQKPETLEDFRRAYQMIVDRGVAWSLTPRVGEMAWKLIKSGDITSKGQTTNKQSREN